MRCAAKNAFADLPQKTPLSRSTPPYCRHLFVVAGGLAIVVRIGAAFGKAGLAGGFLLALAGAQGPAVFKVGAAFLMAAEDEEAGMGVHAVFGAQAVSHGLPVAHEDLADFDIGEGALFQPHEQLADLVHGGHEEAERGAGLHGLDGVVEVFPGGAHVKEEGIGVVDAEAVGDVAVDDLHIVAHAGPFEVAAGQFHEFFAGLVADDAAGGAAEPGKAGGQAAGAATGLDDGTAGTGAEAQADVGDILGIDDLRLALEALEAVVQGGFQHTDGDIQAGAHFAAEAGVVYGFGAEDAVVAVPVLTFLKALDVAPVLVGGDVDHQRAVGDHVFPCGWSGWGQGAGAARKGALRGRSCRAAGAFRERSGLPVREKAGRAA